MHLRDFAITYDVFQKALLYWNMLIIISQNDRNVHRGSNLKEKLNNFENDPEIIPLSRSRLVLKPLAFSLIVSSFLVRKVFYWLQCLLMNILNKWWLLPQNIRVFFHFHLCLLEWSIVLLFFHIVAFLRMFKCIQDGK